MVEQLVQIVSSPVRLASAASCHGGQGVTSCTTLGPMMRKSPSIRASIGR
jgi:hypothetical protein